MKKLIALVLFLAGVGLVVYKAAIAAFFAKAGW